MWRSHLCYCGVCASSLSQLFQPKVTAEWGAVAEKRKLYAWGIKWEFYHRHVKCSAIVWIYIFQPRKLNNGPCTAEIIQRPMGRLSMICIVSVLEKLRFPVFSHLHGADRGLWLKSPRNLLSKTTGWNRRATLLRKAAALNHCAKPHGMELPDSVYEWILFCSSQ